MSAHEIDTFIQNWDKEAAKTVNLLKALPRDKYDFRPDPGSRSLGELAWHLAEGDAYMTFNLALGEFGQGKPPGIERPKQVEGLAVEYERVHKEAVERVRKMAPELLDKKMPFFDGAIWTGREVLWTAVLHHHIHHRGQLVVLCRLAGGVAPGVMGPNREEWAVMMAKMGAAKN